MSKPTQEAFHLTDDLCVDLLQDLLPSPVREQALAHAKECVDCEEMFRLHVADVELARATEAPPVLATSSRTASAPSLWSRALRALDNLMPRPAWGALAAGAAALVIWFQVAPSPDTASPYWIGEESTTLATRSVAAVNNEEVRAGIRAYHEGDAQQAIELLNSTEEVGGIEDLRMIYLASAFLNVREAASAAQVLNDLEIDPLPQPWRDHARLVQALAWEQTGETALAQEMFTKLAERSDEIGDVARRHVTR